MKFIRIVLFLALFFSRSFTSLDGQEANSSNDKKNVFITGGAGFIGSNFVKYMFDKHPEYNFIVLDALTYAGSLENIPSYIQKSPRFTLIHDTILNEDVVDFIMAKSDFVVHFAAESHVTRSIHSDTIFFNTDVLGTRVLMSSLVKHKNIERFIHISTSEVYGTAETIPMDELHLLNARSPYAAAKVGADRLVYSYCCTFDVPAVILRPFNNYGPNQHLEKLIPRLISSAIKGEMLTIHGSGMQKRDWLNTEDTAKAIDAALHVENFSSIKHEIINVGTGIPTSVLDIAKMILQEFNLPMSQLVFIEDRPGQVDNHVSSTSKALKLLNWKASIAFEDGLKKTITWYKDHHEIWKKTECNALIPIQIREGETVLH